VSHLRLMSRLRDLPRERIVPGVRVRLKSGVPATIVRLTPTAAIMHAHIPYVGEPIPGRHVLAHVFAPTGIRDTTSPDVLVEWEPPEGIPSRIPR
jgi:hypothetical protein